MQQKRWRMKWWGMTLFLAGLCPVHAQQASHPCADVAAPLERLACYDKAFPLRPEVVEAAKQKMKEGFGLKTSGKPVPTSGMSAEEAAPDRIESGVVSVEYYGSIRRIALDNQQVWRTLEATNIGPLRQGDRVTVRKGLVGNYLLVTPAGVALRVARVQ